MKNILSPKQKDIIETAAVLAFGGASDKLVNGFRINREKMQIAAVYWSDNTIGNDIEIALCDSRLTEHYNLTTVQAWLDKEKSDFPNDCNIHKHGSDWPIIGMKFDESLEFLKRCRSLRIGFFDKSLLASLAVKASEKSLKDKQSAAARLVISSLLPQSHQDVIDLVNRAGVDVSRWYWKKDGSRAQTPRSNPAFCYNWAFGGGDQPAVICIWHSDLDPYFDTATVQSNFRKHSSNLLKIAGDPSEDPSIRSRSRSQAKRAEQLDQLIHSVWLKNGVLRVIIVEGERRSDESLGKESSVVKRRKLDTVEWNIHRYDEVNGDVFLIRKTATKSISNFPEYVDQFSEPVLKRETVGTSFVRKKSVRDAVLARAQGLCELCGLPGFLTPTGSIYLETHHVIPLSEFGPDNEQNVVALCPNDHRQAHFGVDTKLIRITLQKRLENFSGPGE
ncbi:HNH endonuclease signature motif containing protein [Massilia sp. CFBP9026]|uniref:HNH endonuclease n=1 Tax=Massilia sp. CFBP9026 TaxID=3096536 RepID=UPI002A6A20DA|nr:HNH endonuclease signature motif containing protein [Massilia sp. CFBP9026]MDY0963222.1 HNH endonuclease signature motif containing protein [Massilia sp. CFBP9026]